MAIGVIGVPGTGKSYYLEHRAQRMAKESGAYLIAHDPTLSFRNTAVQRHRTLSQLGHALASSPGGIHTLDLVDGGVAFRAARSVAASSCRQRPEDPSPVLFVLDEIVGFEDTSPNFLDPDLKRSFVWRRHEHLGFAWGSQRPQLVHPMLYDTATELVCFRITAKPALKKLADAGMDDETLALIPRLRDRQFVCWSPQNPHQADGADDTEEMNGSDRIETEGEAQKSSPQAESPSERHPPRQGTAPRGGDSPDGGRPV